MADDAAAEVVEVAAGTAERQVVIAVPWQPGLTAREAVDRSEIRNALPEIAGLPVLLGRCGEAIDAHTVLAPGDRVELCRPLPKDPREMRREILAAGGAMGRRKPPAD